MRLTLRPRAADLEPPDPVLGDHVYDKREYTAMFERNGFDWQCVRRPGAHYQGYLLERRP